jgi:hypothetical protein
MSPHVGMLLAGIKWGHSVPRSCPTSGWGSRGLGSSFPHMCVHVGCTPLISLCPHDGTTSPGQGHVHQALSAVFNPNEARSFTQKEARSFTPKEAGLVNPNEARSLTPKEVGLVNPTEACSFTQERLSKSARSILRATQHPRTTFWEAPKISAKHCVRPATGQTCSPNNGKHAAQAMATNLSPSPSGAASSSERSAPRTRPAHLPLRRLG